VSARKSASAAGRANGGGRDRATRPAARAGRSGKTPGVRAEAGRFEIALRLTVNGRALRARVPPMKRLLDVLREDAELPGSKEGCGEGECGACTVLLDGEPVNSCLVAAGQCEGSKVVTVEGLARGGRLTALQRAFVEMGGAQCGICTPGMLVTSYALIQAARGRVPGEDEVREALAGNLCRCTGYQKIVDAVRAAAAGLRAVARASAAAAGPRAATRARAASARPRSATGPRRAARARARVASRARARTRG
jgi:carbon-monoxide dehydrogenase small subunit